MRARPKRALIRPESHPPSRHIEWNAPINWPATKAFCYSHLDCILTPKKNHISKPTSNSH